MPCLLERPGLQRSIASTMPSSIPLVQAAIQLRRMLMHIIKFSAGYKSWAHIVYRLRCSCFFPLCHECVKKMPAMSMRAICTCLCWSEGMTVACSAEGAGRCRVCR